MGALELTKEALRRAIRARELGYTETGYHATTGDWTGPFNVAPSRDFGLHVAELPTGANERIWSSISKAGYYGGLNDIKDPTWADHATNEIFNDWLVGRSVMPLKVRPGRSTEVPDLGRWDQSENWLSKAVGIKGRDGLVRRWGSGWGSPRGADLVPWGRAEHTDPGLWRDLTDEALGGVDFGEWGAVLKDAMKQNNIDSLRYINTVEARPLNLKGVKPYEMPDHPKVRALRNSGLGLLKRPERAWLLTNPDDVRLPWAEFDPAYQGSGALLKAAGGAVGFGGAPGPLRRLPQQPR